MALDGLVKERDRLQSELLSFNQNIEEQKQSEEFSNDWRQAQQKADYIKKNLRKGNYGYQTDSVAEAILATKLSIEAELEKVESQIRQLTSNPESQTQQVQERNVGGLGGVADGVDPNALPGTTVPMERTEKTFERGDIKLTYRTASEIPVEGMEENYRINCHHDGVQANGSNDCWAFTISLLLKVRGIHIPVSEVKKYRPAVKEGMMTQQKLDEINREIETGETVSIEDMQQIFTDLLGDSIAVKTRMISAVKESGISDGQLTSRMGQELTAAVNEALAAGSPVGMIYSGHYVTISGITKNKDGEVVFEEQNSSMAGTQHISLADYVDRAKVAGKGSIQLLWLKKK